MKIALKRTKLEFQCSSNIDVSSNIELSIPHKQLIHYPGDSNPKYNCIQYNISLKSYIQLLDVSQYAGKRLKINTYSISASTKSFKSCFCTLNISKEEILNSTKDLMQNAINPIGGYLDVKVGTDVEKIILDTVIPNGATHIICLYREDVNGTPYAEIY